MTFSASQWLASFVLDAFIKSVVIGFIGMAITSTSPFPYMWLAVSISIFHFVCLFLGYTAVLAFELVRIEFSPRLKFWLGLLLANALFGAALNTFFAFALSSPPSPVMELSPVTTMLVVTNLIAIFLIAACSWILRRIKRLCAPSTTAV